MRFPLRAWLADRYGRDLQTHEGSAEVTLPCPDCEEGEFWVNTETGKAICYRDSCDLKISTLPKLVAHLAGVTLWEASEIIRNGEEVPDFRQDMLERLGDETGQGLSLLDSEPLPEVDLPTGFTLYDEVEEPPAYFAKRGLTPAQCRTYRLGFTLKGYYRNRLIVPVFLDGRLVSFVARDMTGRAEKKVLDPKGVKKSRFLFNLDRARKRRAGVLCEGVFDAIRVGPEGMAVLGTHLSEAQVGLLLGCAFEDLVVLFDADATEKAEKTAERLRSYGLPARAVPCPSGDPDDYPREALRALLF